jgi:hypothetical protein
MMARRATDFRFLPVHAQHQTRSNRTRSRLDRGA